MKKYFTLVLLVWQALNADAQNCGILDPSFGSGGKAFGITVNASGPSPGSRTIIVQPDSKIIQTANIHMGSYYDFGIVRYTSNGQLDSTFGTNGRVTTHIGTGDNYASAAALQADGKIILIGYATVANNYDFALLRYNSNGILDSSFGVAGKVTTAVGAQNDYASALSIQPDGKIVVVGSAGDNMNVMAFATVRYNSDGGIDSSFGQNGKIIAHLGHFITYIGNQYYGQYANEYAGAVVVQTDGRITVAGHSYSHNGCYDYYGSAYCDQIFAMIRYNSNGSIDSTFGNNGVIKDSSTLLYFSSAALQSDGKIVVSGTGNSIGFITKRYNSNGNLDNSFDGDGIVITQFGGLNSYAWYPLITIKPDGKIVLAGTFDGAGSTYFTVVQYNMNGVPDSSFNVNGTALFSVGEPGSYDEVTGVSIQGSKILVGGNSRNNNNASIVITRLLEGAPIVPVITANGPLSFCEGDSLILSSSETGTMQWYKNNSPIISATGPTYVAKTTGSYKVSVTNSNGCGISSPVVVSTIIPFTPTISPIGLVSFCNGDSVLLSSNAYSGNQWYKDGVALNGATNNTLKVTVSGSYAAKVITGSCISNASNTIIVTVFTTPLSTPSITAGGITTFCSGGDVVLTSNASSGNRWYKNGVLIAGSTATTLNVIATGIYTVKVGLPGCESAESDSIHVTVNNSPVKPPIIWNTPQFSTTSGYPHYQWFFNNTAIAGIDTNIYKPVQTGFYKVSVTDGNGCKNTSDSFNLVALAVSDLIVGNTRLHYYPNPAKTILNIDISNPGYDKLEANLYDVSGRLVHTQVLTQTHNKLPVHKLSAGIYQLVIHNKHVKKIVKVMVIK